METNIFDVLDNLGYSKSLAEKRAKVYDNAGQGVTIFERRNFGGNFQIVIGGSRGDGTGVYLDCDVDKIFVQNGVICVEKDIDKSDETFAFKTVFELETEQVPDGYAHLRLLSMVKTMDDEKLQFSVQQALERIEGFDYLRNDHTLCSAIGPTFASKGKSWLQENIRYSDVKTGPSEPYKIRIPLIGTRLELDEVLAFRCSCPSIISQWCQRVRHSSWPAEDVTEKIKAQDIYVVPVGVKGHKNEFLQWRICLTIAELTLVQTFNDVQIKIYAAMKIVAKHYFKPICDNVTTYIIKNVMFWLMEKMSSTSWEKEHFVDRLKDALAFLKTSVESEELQNYMIPTRNMFENKITPQQKIDLVKAIDSVLLEGICAVTRCREIKEMTAVDADGLAQELKMRQAREELVLAIFSFQPETVARMLRKLFDAQSEAGVVSIFSVDIFTYIREKNPFGYFRHLPAVGNEEFYSTCNFPGCILL